MTDTSTEWRPFRTGRKPPHPPGHPRRLAIPWLHEIDPEVAPDGELAASLLYPINAITHDLTGFPMWGNGPDSTLTIPDAEGPPQNGLGQPVGDCFFAATANAEYIDGNPNDLTSNIVVGGYDSYEADSQGVAPGSEQDDGVVMSDALQWCLTHNWKGETVPLGQGIFVAFVPLTAASVPATMAKYGKPILTGVNLTDCDQRTFPTWNIDANCQPDPNEGHVVLLGVLHAPPVTAGDVLGMAGPISWTKVVSASESWMNACPEEFWMGVGPADRDKMGAAAYDALVASMATLPGYKGETPPTDTPPAPAPPPQVAPPVPVAPPPPPPPQPPPVVDPPDMPTPEEWAQIKAWIEAHRLWLVRELAAWLKEHGL